MDCSSAGAGIACTSTRAAARRERYQDRLLRLLVDTLRAVAEERSRRRIRLALAAAIGVATTMVVLTAIAALSSERGGERGPTAIVPEKQGPFRGNVLPAGIVGKPAPAFELRDVRGGRLSTRELRGRPYIVTFLYTDCPDVCPLIGEELRQTLELLGDESPRVAVVAVSVDPKGDTPAAVREWLRRHREPENFHYLIGSRRELQPVWEAYYAAPQDPAREESAHTASVWLVDADGRWRTKYSGGAPFEPKDVAHDLLRLLDEA